MMEISFAHFGAATWWRKFELEAVHLALSPNNKDSTSSKTYLCLVVPAENMSQWSQVFVGDV